MSLTKIFKAVIFICCLSGMQTVFCGSLQGGVYSKVFETLPVFGTIMSRVWQQTKTSPASSATVNSLLHSVQPNGKWNDIDYADRTIAKWQPAVHLEHLKLLVNAYVSEDARYGDELFNAIQHGLEYWYSADPKSDNWWHNEIGAPQCLGELLIGMRYAKKQLPQSLQDSLIQRMKRGDVFKQTGANKTDVALHYFYRALLTSDTALLSLAVAQTFEPLVLVHYKEGLQYDNSYLQHGPQLQISSYGNVFLAGVVGMAYYVHNTPYALDKQRLELLSNYYRNTYLKIIRGSYSDFNVEGRGVSRKNILSKHSEGKRLALMNEIDPQYVEDWLGAIQRSSGARPASYNVTAFDRHFWIGDYTIHTMPDYSFNIRMVSTRTKRCEAGNRENLLGRYLSDGSTNIQRDGSEYYNIMPVWEWDKIPGVTSRDYATDRPTTVQWGEQGSTAFAGGVSDGLYNASAYVQNYDSVQLKKSWFMFDKEIVCLGAGIRSIADESITTTVNQCWLRGDVFTGDKKQKTLNKEEASMTSKNGAWIWHDSIGYYFPQGGDIRISKAVQTGSWKHINNSFSDEQESGKVFKLWFDHGAKPRNASYAYVVLPAVNSVAEMEKYDGKQIFIIANNDSLQAVKHKGLGVTQIIFYKPGKVDVGGFSVTADKPCILMIKNAEAPGGAIYIADPTQVETAVNITLQNSRSGIQQHLHIDLPTKEMAGSTVSVSLNKE
ncbi:polysaccharide lyase 8 family protein [Pinibacter soli]|uniref:Polysaccharide lyase 8 family protein n=1 Tax=Pinibacter soli TaxID=3044211 RepID=A0ABT6RGL7_9BACT|nr:polysaccharide lyase 8 family protein [Pinibacter soli]MDI3321014.1 polysaccharide lyase 8 family protein [Pinibacter soli]